MHRRHLSQVPSPCPNPRQHRHRHRHLLRRPSLKLCPNLIQNPHRQVSPEDLLDPLHRPHPTPRQCRLLRVQSPPMAVLPVKS